jgi:hypothetical protein
VFGRVFPLVPGPHGHGEGAPVAVTRWRKLATALCATTALFLIVFGLTDAYRLWSGGEVDNRIPFSPVIFASGVMLLFVSAIVYEVLPEKKVSSWEERKHANERVAPFPWQDWLTKDAERALAGGQFRKLARLAERAELAIRDGDVRKALHELEELQRLAAASSVES